jgi:hypothetical protein
MRIFTLRINFLLTFLLFATLGMGQSAYQTVGIIGTATAKGWDASTPMKPDGTGNPNQWNLTVNLNQGEIKFRANNSWDINWGGTSFPSGTGSPNGGNIQVPTAGYYTITFDEATAAYHFEALNPAVYATVGLIGNATPAGWGASTAMEKDPADIHSWILNKITLSQGEVKFRANNNWDVN